MILFTNKDEALKFQYKDEDRIVRLIKFIGFNVDNVKYKDDFTFTIIFNANDNVLLWSNDCYFIGQKIKRNISEYYILKNLTRNIIYHHNINMFLT